MLRINIVENLIFVIIMRVWRPLVATEEIKSTAAYFKKTLRINKYLVCLSTKFVLVVFLFFFIKPILFLRNRQRKRR